MAALTAASDYQTIVRDVLPQFAKADKLEDYDLLFSTHAVATALARLGRWDEANALFVKAQSVWPFGEHANALNIAANQAEFLLDQGKPAEAEVLMEAVIKDARKWGSQINVDAIAGMHHYKACILHELGRDSEAGVAMATAAASERGANLADMHICLGDSKTAKRVLIKALDDDSTRDGVVAFMQTPSEPPLNTAYLRRVRAAEYALRRDPELIAAMANYGRILSFTSDQGARASSSNKR